MFISMRDVYTVFITCARCVVWYVYSTNSTCNTYDTTLRGVMHKCYHMLCKHTLCVTTLHTMHIHLYTLLSKNPCLHVKRPLAYIHGGILTIASKGGMHKWRGI